METEKRITVYYARSKEHAEKALLILKANGIEADRKALGQGLYHDIYGGNSTYGEEITVKESDEKLAKELMKNLKTPESEKTKTPLGKILLATALLLLILLLFGK